jgi:fructuronate reductase
MAVGRGEVMTDRLSLRTISRVPPAARPVVDPGGLGVGVVHLGLGAFHRAHQAQYTEDAIAAAGGDWGICGVTLRSRGVVDQLAPQDGLYTVLTRGPDGVAARVVGSVRQAVFAGTDAVPERIADPAVRVITLTVTEKGYRLDPGSGRLRRADEGIRADAAGGAPRTVLGLLVRGLQARMRAESGPLAVVCCDNLAANGVTLAGLVRDFVDLLPPAEAAPLAAWISDGVTFPSTMVDRIVPATRDEDRAEVARLIGLRDDGPVATEPFRQWVIEDDFPAGRPAWEQAGALLTEDVGPYEVIKLRMLNAAHSLLAYLGGLAGCATIADAMQVGAFATLVDRLMREDVEPTLPRPDGFDIDAYRAQLLTRFGNPALRHGTAQVAMDGSQKLPQRLLPTLRERRAAGAVPRWAAVTLAAWMRWVWTDRCDDGTPRVLDDPLAAELQSAVDGADSARDVVARLLGVRAVFDEELAADTVLRDVLTGAVDEIARRGAVAAANTWIREEPQ